MGVLFEWDLDKSETNATMHSVTFEEAMSVFLDPLSITTLDKTHSQGEERFLTIGRSDRQRLLVVCHTDRVDRIRLISARKSTSNERKRYERSF